MTADANENRAWQAAVLHSAASLAEEAAALAGGGYLVIEGVPAALEVWAESACQAAGRRLVLLDLEGWEPGLSSQAAFRRYREGTMKAAASSAADSTQESGDGDEPLGLFAAAAVALVGAPADRQGFLDQLGSGGPLVVLVADGDVTPEPLRQALRAAVESADGRLTVVDGTRGGRPAEARIEPQLDASGDPRLDAVTDVGARRVLEALAILERPFPLEPLLELLVSDRSRHEQTIDLVDDLLVDELELVEDLGFIHPVFADAVYRVPDPLFAARLLAGVDVEPRAEALLAFLRQRLDPRARSTSLALARLAELAGRGEQARRLLLRLRWWAPAAELEADLAAALDSGQISDVDMLTLAGDGVLGAAARLAVIAVHERAAAPPESEGRLRLYRARALRDAGRIEEALEAIGESLEWHRLNRGRLGEDQVELFLETQLTAARLLATVGEARSARDQLRQARQLAAEVLEPEDPRRAVLAAELGRVLIQVGELRAAQEPLEEAYERAAARFGETHAQAVSARNNLAALLIDIGELESAQAHLVRALLAARRAGLPLPLRLGLWSNLQTATSRLGGNAAVDRLLADVGAQLEGAAAEAGPLAPFAGSVPATALAELGQMLGLDAGLEIDAFEAVEGRLLESLERDLAEPPGAD